MAYMYLQHLYPRLVHNLRLDLHYTVAKISQFKVQYAAFLIWHMRLYDADKDHEESTCLISNMCLIAGCA